MHGDLMWICLVWAERSTPNKCWVPSHRFSSATGEQKGVTQTIYTDSELPSRMPNSLMLSAKLRSANLPFLRLWCDAVGDRTPAPRTPSGRSNHYATHGRSCSVGLRGNWGSVSGLESMAMPNPWPHLSRLSDLWPRLIHAHACHST